MTGLQKGSGDGGANGEESGRNGDEISYQGILGVFLERLARVWVVRVGWGPGESGFFPGVCSRGPDRFASFFPLSFSAAASPSADQREQAAAERRGINFARDKERAQKNTMAKIPPF